MTTRPSARPYSERLWDRVPVWTRVRDQQADGLLHALVSALGVGLDAVRDDVLRLLDDMFVDTCDERLIQVIGDLVGVQVDRQIPVARRRHQVKYAVHLRRRRGTVEAIEDLCWQRTGFRAEVLEPRRRPASAGAQRAAVISGRAPGKAMEPRRRPASAEAQRAAIITGRAPSAPLRAVMVNERGAGDLQVVLHVARPVQRRQVQLDLVRTDSEVHAIAPGRSVPMRRSDGTPIFCTDDPVGLVGPGLAIELLLDGGDFSVLGELVPRFMNLAGEVPIYVPDRAIAIDPERGRVMGPTPPAPGLRARRRYRLRFWQALGAEPVRCTPAAKDSGIYTFSGDGSITGLTDEAGNALRLAFEGLAAPLPRTDERLIVVLEPDGQDRRTGGGRFVALPPGQPYSPALAPAQHPGALPLDTWGLARFFAIEDAWGWDRYPIVRLVRQFGAIPPLEGTVEVDVERGRLRVCPGGDAPDLRVRYFRRFDLEAAKRSGERVVAENTPLGRTSRVMFLDTDPNLGRA